MKRLAVFLDGTYNEPGDNTNVWRLRSMLADTDLNKNPQLSYYDAGVGTNWFDRVRGGMVGVGITNNIREAYQWLIENYDDGDEIYVFGFSRGAFTARSLAGMIAKCGLVMPGSPMPVLQIYQRYENDDSRPLHKLPKSIDRAAGLSQEDRWMVQYSRQVRIKLIGVWDTVGALSTGIIPRRHEERGEYNKHYVRLSRFYEHAYQAIAIDEHRKNYPISRWYNFIPEKVPGMKHIPPPVVEQRWFIGAHSNVGGGYNNDSLPQIPLKWIQSKAQAADLNFRYTASLLGDEQNAPVVDSFANFLKGFYRVVKFGKRYYRDIGEERQEVGIGWIEPHYETIDGSVFDKWRSDENYRPKNLAKWKDKRQLDPGTLTGTQDARLPQE